MTSDKNRNGIIIMNTSEEQSSLEEINDITTDNYPENVVNLRSKRKYEMGRYSNEDINTDVVYNTQNIDTQPQVHETSPVSRRSMNVSGHLRNSMFVLRDVILLKPKRNSSYTSNLVKQEVESSSIESDHMIKSERVGVGKDESCLSTGSFFALRILLVDLFIACCDLASDFVQGYALLLTPDKRVYGIVTLGINWIPGIVAAIHLLSVYRRELPWYRAILYAILLFLFYPIVPILALLIVLWMKPRGNKITKEFKEAEYGATVSYAIHGCIESPIQLSYQFWLALNAVISIQWNDLISINITDWEGNQILISFAAPVCIFFSILR